MKRRSNPNGKSSQPWRSRRTIIRDLAAMGESADLIAARCGVDREFLRRHHAIDLHAGRQMRAAEKAATAPPRNNRDRERAEIKKHIEDSYKSHWYSKEHGNLLYWGALA